MGLEEVRKEETGPEEITGSLYKGGKKGKGGRQQGSDGCRDWMNAL